MVSLINSCISRLVFFKVIILMIGVALGCKQTASNSMNTPEDVYSNCTKKFQAQGAPQGVGQQFCGSMRDACNKDLNSEECQKAQRMVAN